MKGNRKVGSPYSGLEEAAFWRLAVADRHVYDLGPLIRGPLLSAREKVATAGSCFAQHIGRYLRERGANYLDLEPAPEGLSEDEARRFGFGIFSCRYGNIYTARQLLQLLAEALGERVPSERVWEKEGRYYDALRPAVDPVGYDSPDDVLAVREAHLRQVRELFSVAEVFVFTLGLTEAWAAVEDGTVYPSAPGVIAGRYQRDRYRFVNFRYPEVRGDLEAFWSRIRAINPRLRMILTVSPVPLTATASGEHVLVANTWSKSTLRAVAGDLAAAIPEISYFPSFELITAHPTRAMFFNPDLRTVNAAGVAYVMSHFFGDEGVSHFSRPSSAERTADLICDEEANDPQN